MTPIIIDNVLSSNEVAELRAELAGVGWERGLNTAGPIAAGVKNNWQAKGPDVIHLYMQISDRVRSNELFQSLVRPTALGFLFSRYEVGSEYGSHVDDGMLGKERRDVSFTIGLTEHAAYDGGQLVIETNPFDSQSYKIGLGSMIVYPATSLHHVTPVTRGERLVIVGWARSLFRSDEQRELMFDLGLIRSSLFNGSHGRTTPEINLLSKTIANLTRMWATD